MPAIGGGSQERRRRRVRGPGLWAGLFEDFEHLADLFEVERFEPVGEEGVEVVRPARIFLTMSS
jgi:hypothetical protein